MTQITVYTMSDIYKKADAYAKSFNGEVVDYIEIGVPEDNGGILIMVHYSDKKRKKYLGSFKLDFNIMDILKSNQIGKP